MKQAGNNPGGWVMTVNEVARWLDSARGLLQALVLALITYFGSTTVDTRTQVQLLGERFGKIVELERRVADLGQKIDLQTVNGATVGARLDVLEARAGEAQRRLEAQGDAGNELRAEVKLLEQRVAQLTATVATVTAATAAAAAAAPRPTTNR